MSPRLAFALDALHEAGRFTLAHFQTGVTVDIKSDESPVTAADRGAERILRDRIAAAFPQDAILGEEEGESAGQSGSQGRWIIDPIDGTKSFVSGVPLYSNLLAFERNGVLEIGVVGFPALGEMVYAERGGGAFWNGRPCRVSSAGQVRGGLIVCGSPGSLAEHGRLEGLLKLSEKALATRTWGDAYGHCLVATGRAVAMIDPVLKFWDIAAVQVVVEEAGGRCSDFRGQANPTTEMISSNGAVHDEILEAFGP
ncbi:MAG: inositol monophosphatase family protein [Fimbriimonadaceae bacterium]